MYTEYIILICLTSYLIPTVISVDESDYAKRYKEIIGNEKEDYITYRSLTTTYNDYEIDELEDVLEYYAVTTPGNNGISDRRLYFDRFKEAAFQGYIHRYRTQEMIDLFFKIIGDDVDRGYIIHSDLVTYYKGKVPIAQIDIVINTYGRKRPDGMRLSFFGFRRGINTLKIPNW
ncbi:uncharacterized protein LOC126834895 [Adelges cooleyi]|uniref:uncharacterized protein LOC126834895 n=1 Tax=Adelges cooleyi TaxID=133065 RepID=UPI0021801889|nr:uncharacterized protein LOC126834895 [Adelges cooleyi]